MSNETTKNQQQQPSTTNSANEDQYNSNSSKIKIKGADGQIHEYDTNEVIIQRTPIDDTDFEIVGNDELGYILTLGRFKLTEPLQTKEQVVDYLNQNPWKITIALTYAVVKAIQEANLSNLNKQ